MKPDFNLPTAIYTKQNLKNSIAEIAQKYGSRAILITTSEDFEIYYQSIEIISNQLREYNIGCIIYDELPPYPTTEDIDVAVSFIQKTNSNLIIGFGGIEALNAAKAISILNKNYIFCNNLFNNPELTATPLPLISIPAYPLFGFEIAPILYLVEINSLTKKVYYNESIYPKATIVDPDFSMTISDDKAIKSTIATLAIATESIISTENNEIINTYSLKAIDLIFRNLPLLYSESKNIIPRTALATASLMSGISFSVAYLSVTFAISLALTSKTDLSIEDAMSVIFPHIMDFNLTSSPGKYVQMAKVMGEQVKDITVIEAAIKSVEAIRRLETDVEVPMRLSAYNISKTLFKEISQLAMSYPFIKNTPRELNTSEIETILIAAY